MYTINDYLSAPGEILLKEFLEPKNITIAEFSDMSGLSEHRLREIIANRHWLTTPDTEALASALGTTPEFWQGLAHTYQMRLLNY